MKDQTICTEGDDVRLWVFPTGKARRKPTYGRYRFNGKAKDRLSRTRAGDAVEYELEELDARQLVLVAKTDERAVQIAIAGTSDGLVTITTRGERVDVPMLELEHVGLLYASGLAMTWEWCRQIELDMHRAVAPWIVAAFARRRHLGRAACERETTRKSRRKVRWDVI